MTPYSTDFIAIGDRQYHIRQWGDPAREPVFLLHGWMDSSATFQFLADALGVGWNLIAPDWRGFGDSDWNHDSYYFPDYLADLDHILEHYSPGVPATLVGHSMGAMIASIYAGVRPSRVSRLALIEGFGLSDTDPEEAPGRYARWLREKRSHFDFRPLLDRGEAAARLIERNPHLSPARADWLAEELTRPQGDGTRLYRADPRHKMVNPALYHLEEAKACWRKITCPVLWVAGEDPWEHPQVRGVLDTLDERRACFADLNEIRLASCGHMVQWEAPEELALALAAFLRPY
jgi:pimeloyl-ACP methyl ester carboxylesterase